MRHFILTAFLCFGFFGVPAMAEETTEKEPVRIEVDQKAKTFTFIIDGEPVAMLDRNGLQIVEHLSYGGMLTDKGRESARRDIQREVQGGRDE